MQEIRKFNVGTKIGQLSLLTPLARLTITEEAKNNQIQAFNPLSSTIGQNEPEGSFLPSAETPRWG